MSNIKETLKERILNQEVDNIFTQEIFEKIQITEEEYNEGKTTSGFKHIKKVEKKYKKHYKNLFNDIFKDLELDINHLEKLKTCKNQNFVNKENQNTFVFEEMIYALNTTAIKYIILEKINHINNLFEEKRVIEAYSYVYNQKYYSRLILYLMTLVIKTNNFELHFKQDIILNSINKTINRDLIYLYTEIGISEVFELYNHFKYMIFKGEHREIGCDIEEKDLYNLVESQKKELIEHVGSDLCLSTWFTFDIETIEKYFPKIINEKTIKVLVHDKIEPFLSDFEGSGLFILTKIYKGNNAYFWYIMSLLHNEKYKFTIIEKIKTKAILDNF